MTQRPMAVTVGGGPLAGRALERRLRRGSVASA